MTAVDVDARPITDRWSAPDGEQATAAIESMGNQFALGGSNLSVSFHSALKAFDNTPADRRRIVVYVGTGGETLDKQPLRAIARSLGEQADECQARLVFVSTSGDDQTRALAGLLRKIGVACGSTCRAARAGGRC